jgi:hypothetical protein
MKKGGGFVGSTSPILNLDSTNYTIGCIHQPADLQVKIKVKISKEHRGTGTEALYRP